MLRISVGTSYEVCVCPENLTWIRPSWTDTGHPGLHGLWVPCSSVHHSHIWGSQNCSGICFCLSMINCSLKHFLKSNFPTYIIGEHQSWEIDILVAPESRWKALFEPWFVFSCESFHSIIRKQSKTWLNCVFLRITDPSMRSCTVFF